MANETERGLSGSWRTPRLCVNEYAGIRGTRAQGLALQAYKHLRISTNHDYSIDSKVDFL